MIIRQCSRSGERVLALFASALRSIHAPARSLCAGCEVRLWCCKARTLTSHRAMGRALPLRQSRPRQLQVLSFSGNHACHRQKASKSRRAWATPAPTSRQHWVSNALPTQPRAYKALQPALHHLQSCVTCSFCPRNEHCMQELAFTSKHAGSAFASERAKTCCLCCHMRPATGRGGGGGGGEDMF